MGSMRHHAIIVTSFQGEITDKAYKQAKLIFRDVSQVFISPVNSYFTFFIPPDGSKEGWPESDVGDKQRDTFMDWCDCQAYEDGSNAIDAVVVRYHDYEREEKI